MSASNPSPTPASAPQGSPRNFSQQKAKRLLQILRATQLALLVGSLLFFSQGNYLYMLVMLGTAVLLFSVDRAVERWRLVLGTWILLGGLSLMLVYFSIFGSGVRGSVPLGYSGVLLFSALLGSRRQLLFFMLLAITNCLVVGYLNQSGLYVNAPPPINLVSGAIAAVVISLIGFCAMLLADDYRRALRDLERENSRVKDANSHIEHLALHDPLTNLPNRAMAQANFRSLYNRCSRDEQLLGVIFIDLDNLKPINDSLGHRAGDAILAEVASRLRKYTGDDNLCCRYGGDEFLVFLPYIGSEEEASTASGDILQLISQTYMYQGVDIFCTCSIGIALAPQDGDNLDELIKKADIAMYHSKESGRNSFRFFNDAIYRNMSEHVSLISALRRSLELHQFELHYQPKIDLQSNRLVGFEALLRWNHPEQGYISPSTFIPLAESSGLIIPLGEWVINEACRQARLWQDAGWGNFSIAINISSIQFKRGNIDSLVFNALTSSGLSPRYLELELTESLLIEDSERLANTLASLRSEGVHFSIDDFGTGYSNLGYLKKFEVEALKIDQSFVRKMDHHSGDAVIVRAIIQMANSLGLKTIAEGVEDASTAALLRTMGCTLAQGYYWARPMPADEAETYWHNFPAVPVSHNAPPGD